MTTNFKGCTFVETSTTTDGVLVAFGKAYTLTRYVWAISGRYNKPAGQRPFLTSAKACREYVREMDMLNSERGF